MSLDVTYSSSHIVSLSLFAYLWNANQVRALRLHLNRFVGNFNRGSEGICALCAGALSIPRAFTKSRTESIAQNDDGERVSSPL